MEYLNAYLFTAIGIAGVLVLGWIGWSQTRGLRTTRRELQREHSLREWMSHVPVRRTAHLNVPEELRVIAVEATETADRCTDFAEEARETGDEALASFFEDAARTHNELADDALDILRERLPEELPLH